MLNFAKSSFLLIVALLLSSISLEKAEAVLLVASRGSGEVLSYERNTGEFIGTFIKEGSGGLIGPSSLVVGEDGLLYVSDYFNSSVLRYDLITGKFVDTFIAPGEGGLSNPESVAFGSDGDFYIAGLNGMGVRRYDGSTGAFIEAVIPFVPATRQPLSTPNFSFYGDNRLFISAVLPTNGVLSYDRRTNITETFIPPHKSPEIPGGLAIGKDGLLYVSDFILDNASIRRYSPETGELIDTFVSPGSGGLSQASRLLFTPEDDNLYVTSFGSNSVLRYDGKTGVFIDAFVSSGSGGLSTPIGLAFSPSSVPQTTSAISEPTNYLGILGLGLYLSITLIAQRMYGKYKRLNAVHFPS